MNVVQRLFYEKMALSTAKQLAKQVSKDDFLKQLKDAWEPYLDLKKPTNDIVDSCFGRIKQMKFESVFDTVGVNKIDLKNMVEELKNETI